MFGNILIDKLQLNIYESDLIELNFDTKEFKENIREVLSRHYSESAFKVYSQRKEVKINLTPTRYIVPEKPDVDNNLQMPSEDWFNNLFLELGFDDERLSEAFRVVELHLTKNIITNLPTPAYIDYLLNRKYHRMKASIIQSSSKGRTLSIATQRFKTDKEDTAGDRQFIFYEKVQQLKDKIGGWYIDLKQPINPKILPFGTTSQDGGRLYLNDDLHILRAELQYKYSTKLKKLAQFIENNKEETTLRLSLFIRLMEDDILYDTLERFYISELKEFVFYENPESGIEKKLSFWKEMLVDLMGNTNTKLMQAMYNDYGLGNKYRFCIKDIQPKMNMELYQELHTKLCTLNQNKNPQDESRLLTVLDSG